MTFQISKILLYSNKERFSEPQCVSFKENTLNIITGKTLSGKSAMLNIVEFCLGANSTTFPDGLIPKYVSWIGVEFFLNKNEEEDRTESFIVVRNLPRPGLSNKIYTVVGQNLPIPKKDELNDNTSYSQLVSLIKEKLGLNPEKVFENSGATYVNNPNLLHEAVSYCFQSQNEIGEYTVLFHGKRKNKITNIREWLPFFLGAASADYADQKHHLNSLYKRRDDLLRSKKEGLIDIQTETFLEEAKDLFSLSQEVQLIPYTEVLSSNLESVCEQFTLYNTLPITSSQTLPLDDNASLKLSFIEKEIEETKNIISEYETKRSKLKSLKSSKGKYGRSLTEQVDRLKTIGVIPKSETNNLCPLCHSPMDIVPPKVSEINQQLKKLEGRLESLSESDGSINVALIQYENIISDNKKKLNELNKKAELLKYSTEHLRSLRDKSYRQVEVIGMIQSFLRRVSKEFERTSHLKSELEEINSQIDEWEEILESYNENNDLTRILSAINDKLTAYSYEIGLFESDYSEYKLSLDLENGTIFINSQGRMTPLSNIGGGTRWVALHVILHMVLHEYFSTNNCPIPAFLFLDQPSQANASYDYSHITDSNADLKPNDNYRLLIELITRIIAENPYFQVIITEQVNYGPAHPWFNDYVAEDWWKEEKKLVKNEWMDKEVELSDFPSQS